MHPVLKEALERSPVMPVLVIPELSMLGPLFLIVWPLLIYPSQ